MSTYEVYKPNVLYVRTGLWPGGVNYADLNLLDTMQQNGFKVRILTGALSDELRYENNNKYRIPIEINSSLDKLNRKEWSGDKRVREISDAIEICSKKHKSGVIFVGQPFYNFPEFNEAVVSSSRGHDTVLRIHDPVDDESSLRKVSQRTKGAVTTGIIAGIIKDSNPTMDVSVIPPGLDFSDFESERDARRKIRQRHEIGGKDIVILQPTRVASQKRIDRAVNLAHNLQDRLSGERAVYLLVTGGNEPIQTAIDEKRRLEKISRKLGFSNLIFLNGVPAFGGDFRLTDYYNSADLVTFMSETEGFGLPPAESSLVGIPCVTTRYTDSRSHSVFDEVYGGFEFIMEEDRTGEGVSSEVIDQVVEAIEKPESWKEKKERNRRLVEKYSLDSIKDTLMDLLSKFNRNI